MHLRGTSQRLGLRIGVTKLEVWRVKIGYPDSSDPEGAQVNQGMTA